MKHAAPLEPGVSGMRMEHSADPGHPAAGGTDTEGRHAGRVKRGLLGRFLISTLLMAVSVAIALLIGEAVVRLLYKDQTVMFPRYHADYRYGPYTLRGIRPGAEFWHTSVDGTWKFITNSRGFRDAREFAYEKPSGTFRVLSLGDSHTQGYEVRQDATFSGVLERYLARDGARAEVLNAGVSGYSTAEALAFLENEGYRYQPDAVVLGFYANDFEDNLKAGLFALERGQLVARKYEHIPGVRLQEAIYALPGTQWLGENSYLYSTLFNSVWVYFKNALRDRTRAGSSAGAADVEYAVATKSRHSEYEVALGLALIERMKRFCDRHDIRFIVVEIPRQADRYHFAESLTDTARAALNRAGVEVLSSDDVLGRFDGAAELHVAHGHNHISEFTHALIGIELGRRIRHASSR